MGDGAVPVARFFAQHEASADVVQSGWVLVGHFTLQKKLDVKKNGDLTKED